MSKSRAWFDALHFTPILTASIFISVNTRPFVAFNVVNPERISCGFLAFDFVFT